MLPFWEIYCTRMGLQGIRYHAQGGGSVAARWLRGGEHAYHRTKAVRDGSQKFARRSVTFAPFFFRNGEKRIEVCFHRHVASIGDFERGKMWLAFR